MICDGAEAGPTPKPLQPLSSLVVEGWVEIAGASWGAWSLRGSLAAVAEHPRVRVKALTADVEVPATRVLAPPLVIVPADLQARAASH